MLAVAGVFYLQGSSFGLFKLAMYAQPFLLGTLAVAWARLGRWRWAALPALLALACFSARTQHGYASQSFGQSGMVEQKSASEDAIFRRLHEQMQSSDADQLIVATEGSFATKFVAASNDGRPLRTPVYPFLAAMTVSLPNRLVPAGRSDRLRGLSDAVMESFPQREFDLHDPKEPARVNRFVSDEPPAVPPRRPAVVLQSGKLSILNRHRLPESTTTGLRLVPLSQVHDHLALVDSERGRQCLMALGSSDVAMYQLEMDYFRPGYTMASLGRDLLFEVLGPSPRPRMLIELTTSLAANGDCRLPEAAVIGGRRVALPLTGRGTARVIAEPVEPQPIAGRHYLALDLGERKFQFRARPTRWDLFGRSVNLDRRLLTAFGRDVSLLSEEEYGSLRPPAMASKFPDDLTHPDLEFSGIYEDGWLSEHAWMRPSAGGPDAFVVVEGVVPQLGDPGFRTTLTVLVEGREVWRRELAPGEFSVREKLSGLPARPKVELTFSGFQRLPEGDGRPVSAQVKRVGFEPTKAK
jgi:hypothetical protein